MSLPQDIEGVRVLAERLAREHAEKGGKVVGYVTPCVPAELISAAGLYPIMLSAGTETSTTLGDRVMEDLFDTTIRGIFERLLKGEFDYLSAIVLPRANDSAHRLYYYLCELQRRGEAKLPPILLCDVVMTPDEPTRQYSIAALGRLWVELKALGKSDATEADILGRMAMWNALVAPVQQLCGKRRANSGPLPSAAHILAVIAALRMLPEEAVPTGPEWYSTLNDGTRLAGARVIICGSPQGDAGLHGLVEAAGGVVAGDYHANGDLCVHPMYDLHKRLPPLEVLADRLRADLAASRRFLDTGPHIADFARACGAKLAIFSYLPEEEALTWDYPEQKAALEAVGVRVLRLAGQARPFDVDAHREAVTAFIKGGA
jgi:hypothetical protein